MNLTLAPGLLEEIVEHAKGCHPKEGCGLLAGPHPAFGYTLPGGEGAASATRFIPMQNIRMSSTEYEMDPGRLVNVLRDLRNTGEDLVAIFHSHPFGPAQPSRHDIERSYYPDAAYLIVSLAEPERPQAAAFRIIDGEVTEVEVHVIV